MKMSCKLFAFVIALVLIGCGGSSVNSGGGSNNITYTIGGTITGLTASGLVLADGTDTAAPEANATIFVFPTSLASGASYSVTVKTQPTGLTCSVTAGSGTVASGNVTNVQVACVANATYTIGGAISGLTTGGLVLANGTDTTSPAANASTFVFPTALATGTSYSVTVSAQPAGATCTVTNGSGTVATSNVTNIQVTCSAIAANTYTIGGTISSLTQSGLVLANGTDTVSPAANATAFVFPTALATGASYAVTVKTQPTNETCSVSNGSGSVVASDVTNVQVICTPIGSYTIGGTIIGLTADGLTLANGTENVSPPADATSFVFPYPQSSGVSYSVNVSAQPSGLTCTVTNGSGTVGSSNITNVQVACVPVNSQTFVPLVVMPKALTSATSGTPYSQTLTASGTGPFTWTGSTIIDSNSAVNAYPNNNLSISSTGGVIKGTPYYTGIQPILLSVSRADGASAYPQVELSISGSGSSQSITNTPQPATQGAPYLWQMQTSWGYTGVNLGCLPGAMLVFGSIPPGLTFNALNTTAGTLFGTPTMAGAYTMTFMADPGSCATEPTNYKTVTLTIGPASSPTTPAGSSNWTRQRTSAVLAPSSSGWDSFVVGSPSVITVGSTYNMYYEGLNTSSFAHAIGLATSTDGVNWIKTSAAPVLQATSGAWDSTEVRYPAVVKNGSNYLMIYQGTGNSTELGLATSTDGISWTKNSGAVFTTQGVHSVYVPGSLLYLSGQYVLYYTVDGYIGRMTSTEGQTWNDDGPVFSPSTSAVVFSRPSVVYDGTTYRMWFTRIADANDATLLPSGLFTVTIGYADSPDGLTWTTYGNPIFTAGAAGAWDRPGVGDPSVYYDGTTFHMWYVGGREEFPFQTPDSDTWVEGSIGYALIP